MIVPLWPAEARSWQKSSGVPSVYFLVGALSISSIINAVEARGRLSSTAPILWLFCPAGTRLVLSLRFHPCGALYLRYGSSPAGAPKCANSFPAGLFLVCSLTK